MTRCLVLLIATVFSLQAWSSSRCETELGQIQDFALRETDRLHQLLSRVKSEIEQLPPREKLRAKIRWVEADSARLELEKSLVAAQVPEEPVECAMTAESIRAGLFRTQELGFNLSLDYDARMKTEASPSTQLSRGSGRNP